MIIPGIVLKALSYPGFIASCYVKKQAFEWCSIQIIEFEPTDILEEPIFILIPEQKRRYYLSLIIPAILLVNFALLLLGIASERVHFGLELLGVYLAVSIGAHALPRWQIVKLGWSAYKDQKMKIGERVLWFVTHITISILSLLNLSQLGYIYLLVIYFIYMN